MRDWGALVHNPSADACLLEGTYEKGYIFDRREGCLAERQLGEHHRHRSDHHYVLYALRKSAYPATPGNTPQLHSRICVGWQMQSLVEYWLTLRLKQLLTINSIALLHGQISHQACVNLQSRS